MRNDDGYTPLHWAVSGEVVQMLMDHGGDLSVRDKSGRTPLHQACRCHILSSVQVMVDHLADVNARNVDGDTPLMLAVTCGSVQGDSEHQIKKLSQR